MMLINLLTLVVFPGIGLDEILTQLESQGQESPAPMKQTHAVSEQISLFDAAEENPILAELAKVDVYNMTPMQAMNLLLEWKQKL